MQPRWRAWLNPPVAGGARAKVAGLGVIAAVPLVLLAGVVVSQTYDSASATALQTADALARTAVAEYTASIRALQVRLAAIAVPPGCTSAETDTFLAWAMFDPAGDLRCAAGPVEAVAALQALPGRGDWLGRTVGDGTAQVPLRTSGGGPVATVSLTDGTVLAGLLPPDWFATALPEFRKYRTATWLLDPGGSIVAIRGSTAASVPSRTTLQTLLEHDHDARLAPALDGTNFAYVSTRLASGWRIIEAHEATGEYEAATRSMILRLAALGLLLLMGLAAIVVGAAISFGEPIRQLSAAVLRWQDGRAFDPGPLPNAPSEVRELARSFSAATAALRQREAELANSIERQELLVLEIHHRVKNNLQIVASLLNLQASRIRVPEARAEFQAARDRVRALATLHRHLYSDGELHTINMRSFLVELCGQLFQALGETADDRITLSIEAPELRMSSDQAVPLALIVTEAVTNSVRYAFPNGRRGEICVRLTDHGGVLDLVIEDDGVGIPAADASADEGRRNGIGLQLIRGFARQLGASLDVKEAQGTRYSVRLALKPPTPAMAPEPLDAA